MTKSSFYGYTQRVPGTAWVLRPLPLPNHALFTSTETDEIESGSIIPVRSASINQVGGAIHSDGSFSLPVGLYKIKFQTTVTGTTEIVIGLRLGSTSVVKVTEPVGTSTVSGETLISCPGCGIRWAIYNDSADPVAVEMMGSYSVSVIIEKIY